MYKRVILKLSGESFSHGGERGIGMQEVVQIASQIKQAANAGCQIGLVIGGGLLGFVAIDSRLYVFTIWLSRQEPSLEALLSTVTFNP